LNLYDSPFGGFKSGQHLYNIYPWLRDVLAAVSWPLITALNDGLR